MRNTRDCLIVSVARPMERANGHDQAVPAVGNVYFTVPEDFCFWLLLPVVFVALVLGWAA
jgi:hypothetical protein